MNISTNTTAIVTIELTEQEARTALVEPEDLQRQIRSALAPVAAKRQTRKSIHPGQSDPKASMRPSASGKTACAICGKSLKPRGMALHLRKAHPDAATAETD